MLYLPSQQIRWYNQGQVVERVRTNLGILQYALMLMLTDQVYTSMEKGVVQP